MDNYKKLLSDIEKHIKLKGWVRKANTFYFFDDNNWALLNFQKSKASSSSAVLFTINLGISSTLLRKFDEKDIEKKPTIDECHWKKRIGFLLPQKQDYWWKITDSVNLEKIISEIKELLNNFALPEVNKYLSDAALGSLWLSGISHGLTNFQRLINLTTILKIHNNENLLLIINELLTFCKGKPCEFNANFHIKQLGFDYE
jgi:hypothetical protein